MQYHFSCYKGTRTAENPILQISEEITRSGKGRFLMPDLFCIIEAHSTAVNHLVLPVNNK